MDGRSPSRQGGGGVEKRQPRKKRSTKPTAGEAAYLRALLKDEPTAQHQHGLALLRGGVPLPGTAGVAGTGPSSGSGGLTTSSWGRIASSTTNMLDCLKMFTSVEILEDDNSFACHNCWKMTHPEEAEENRLRRKRRRRRRQSGHVRENAPSRSTASSSESDSDAESSSDSSSSDDEDVRPPERSASLLRPDLLVARALSADAAPMREHTPSISLAITSGEAAIARRASLKSEPGRIRAVRPLDAPSPPADPASLPHPSFPILNIPAISTSLPSPTSSAGTAPLTAKPAPFGAKLTPSSPRVRRPTQAVEDESAVDADETDAEGDGAPRFRRFSSFHAEKFLSPNVSRESLASAPPDEGMFSFLRRRKRGLSTLPDQDGENENAFATDDESDIEGGGRVRSASPSPDTLGLSRIHEDGLTFPE